MSKPKLSRADRKTLKAAIDAQRIAPGQQRRALLLAEAIQRVEEATDGSGIGEVAVRRIDRDALLEAIGLLETGGLYVARQQADGEERERLDMVSEAVADTCEAASCSVNRVCRDRKGRFVNKACDESQPDRRLLESGAVVWVGRRTSIATQTASGVTAIDAQYALVPIDAVIPSHDPLRGFIWSDGYPRDLQERDYSTETERTKVVRAADKFDPRLMLGDNASALEGPPVIDNHGFVLGGNGRTMILQTHLARSAKNKYEGQLREELGCNLCYGLQGAPTEDMMLVRILVGRYDRKSVSALLNASLTTTLNRAAAAVSTGLRIPDYTLSRIADAMAVEESFAQVVNMLGGELVEKLRQAGIITPANQLQWLRTSKGSVSDRLSREGKARLAEALVGAFVRRQDALRDASDSLFRWMLYVSPVAIVLDRWAKEPGRNDEALAYDWTESFRHVAHELALTSDLPPKERRDRFAAGQIFEDEDGPLDAFRDWRDAIVFKWALNSRTSPRKSAQRVAAYWRAIPVEVKSDTVDMFSRSSDELAAQGLDPDQLMHSVLGMDTLEEARSYGSIRGYLAGRIDKRALRRQEEAEEAEFERDEDEDDDLVRSTIDGVDAVAVNEQFYDASRDYLRSRAQADAEMVEALARRLERADALEPHHRRWLQALGLDPFRRVTPPVEAEELVDDAFAALDEAGPNSYVPVIDECAAGDPREPLFIWRDLEQQFRFGVGGGSDLVVDREQAVELLRQAQEDVASNWASCAVSVEPYKRDVKRLRQSLHQIQRENDESGLSVVSDTTTAGRSVRIAWPDWSQEARQEAVQLMNEHGWAPSSMPWIEWQNIVDGEEIPDRLTSLRKTKVELPSAVYAERVVTLRRPDENVELEEVGAADPADRDDDIVSQVIELAAQAADEYLLGDDEDDEEDEPLDLADLVDDEDDEELDDEEDDEPIDLADLVDDEEDDDGIWDEDDDPWDDDSVDLADLVDDEDEESETWEELAEAIDEEDAQGAPARAREDGPEDVAPYSASAISDTIRGVGPATADGLVKLAGSWGELAWWTDPESRVRYNGRKSKAKNVARKLVSGLGPGRAKTIARSLHELGVSPERPLSWPTGAEPV